ncbi:hypothetical protein ACFL2O_08335 [Thermodesulfobacteriota bacterium]
MTSGKLEKVTQKFDWESFKGFVKEFSDESDRAAVVLGAAKLDQLLYQILQRKLLPAPSSRDELLDGESALGTFSARINVCYRLCLIDAYYTRALHMIRKIRNAFAHEIDGCSLQAGSHRDRIRDLEAPLVRYEEYCSFKKQYFDNKSGPSVSFRSVLAIMVGRLQILADHVTAIKPNETGYFPIFLIGESWHEVRGES